MAQMFTDEDKHLGSSVTFVDYVPPKAISDNLDTGKCRCDFSRTCVRIGETEVAPTSEPMVGGIRCPGNHLRPRRKLAGTMIKAPEPTSAPQATAPFDGYPCPTCGKGQLHVTMHLAPRRRGQGVMNACPSLGTRAHPSRGTGRSWPATALTPTLENGLQFTQNHPRVSPAAPSDARFAPLRASPTC
jgi:hypothetical protein